MGVRKIHIASGPDERKGNVGVSVLDGAEQRGLPSAASCLVHVTRRPALEQSYHHVEAALHGQGIARFMWRGTRWGLQQSEIKS